MARICLIWKARLSLKEAELFCIPTSNIWEFFWLHIHTALGIVIAPDFGHFNRHVKSVSYSVISESLWLHGLQPANLLCPWNSPDKSTGVGSHSFLQRIFLTKGLNPGLPHCWRRQRQPTPVLLPGWRSLVGCSPWGHEESKMTERLHFHFSF